MESQNRVNSALQEILCALEAESLQDIRHRRDIGGGSVFNRRNGRVVSVDIDTYIQAFGPSVGTPLEGPAAPYVVDVQLTNVCNLACPHCVVETDRVEPDNYMDLHTWRTILEQLHNWGVFQVAYGEGEPTIHPNFRQIIQETRDAYDMVPNITSNLLRRLDDSEMDVLASYCGTVACSIDAWHYPKVLEKGVPRTTLDNIRGLLTRGAHMAVTHVYMLKNLSDVPLYLEYIVSLGIREIGLSRYFQIDHGPQDNTTVELSYLVDQFGEILSKADELGVILSYDTCSDAMLSRVFVALGKSHVGQGCAGARKMGLVTTNSLIKPCSFSKPPYIARFSDGWNGSVLQKFREVSDRDRLSCIFGLTDLTIIEEMP